MLWLYLHFPHLLLDHLRRARETPVATVIVAGPSALVTQACPLARQQGVHSGMRLKTALALVPELTLARTEPHQEQTVLEQQARWLYRHAAQIVLYPPDGLLLEASSLLRLYGNLQTLWHTLEQALEARQLTAWMATGQTPLSARLQARRNQGECQQDTGWLEQQMLQLPLKAAEFAPATLERLTRLGLSRLGDVFSLPPGELARRLAPETLVYVQKIQGTRADPQHFWQPPHRFHQQVDFIREVEQAQGLLFPLPALLAELEEDLLWRQMGTDSLQLTLSHRDSSASSLSIRLSGPEHRADTFLELIRLRLEQHTLTAPVVTVALTVSRFLPRDATAGSDLLGEATDLREAWQTLFGRLQARLGTSALQQLSPHADHRPERAWMATHMQRPRTGDHPPEPLNRPQRPLWLLPLPQPLHASPEAWLAGPERISSGWWDGARVQRDYYIAQLPGGQMAWVFRDVRDGWFIHGWFG